MVQINVTDLDEAIEWYKNTLGFELSKENYHHPVAVDLINEGNRLLLNIAEKTAKIDYPKDVQTLICFQTNDILATIDHLQNMGVDLIHQNPQKFPGGLFAAFRDPFGNVHELVEFQLK
jgi:catechol 2,3-dioxygenase-like lactoylglutathione lyase family enzyme